MNEQLKFLIELQEIDTSILSLADKIESLPEKLRKLKAPLKEAEDAFQKIKAKSEILNKKKKEKDLQLDETQDKIDKLKARSTEIKTNKEYEAHLKEIEGYEKNRYRIEEEILVLMEDIENFSNEVIKQEEAKVKKAEEEYKQQEKAQDEEKQKLENELETVKARRNDFASRLDSGTYAQYMNLMKKLGGLAVVPTKNEVCLGCNTNIPPQLYNDIKGSNDIYTCFYCNRFLYFKDDTPPENKSQDSVTAS